MNINKVKLIELTNNQSFIHMIEMLFILLLILTGCSTYKQIPVNTIEETKINYIDSLVIRDSVVIIPKVEIHDVVNQYDTLILSSNYSISKSYIDTSLNVLKGELKDKQGIQYKYKTIDHFVEHTDTVYISKEVPIEIEKEVKYVPKFYKYLLGYAIFSILGIALAIYLKFKKHI